MKKSSFLLAGLAMISALSIAWAAGVEIKEDKSNILASRLAGTWLADNSFDKRLGQPHGLSELTFTNDPKAAALVPEKWAKHLKKDGSSVYAAGSFTIRSKSKGNKAIKGTYVVTTAHGNPLVLCVFQEEAGGGAEAIYVNLIPAKDKTKDILFVGGDNADDTFAAFSRKK